MSKHHNYNKQYAPKEEKVYEPVVLDPNQEPVINVNKVPEKVEQKIIYEVVSNAPLNFRAYPKLDADIRAMLKPGTMIQMIQDMGEWCEVKFGDSIGFVMKEFIKKV